MDNYRVDLLWEAGGEPTPGLGIQPFFRDLIARLGLENVELALLVIRDDRMRELNSRYRHKKETTDVLSFPNQAPTPPGEARHLGDIAISLDRAKQQAQQIGHSLAREIRFLGMHGLLHLMGYDHETDNGKMHELQTQLKQDLAEYFS